MDRQHAASLILAVRPQEHQLLAIEADEAELVCATLQFDGGANNPLTLALPDFIIKPLRELQGLSGTLDWLFEEAFGDECGRDVILNRLFELMVIQLLRHLIASRSIASGMMAGLANAQLSRALVGIHNEPQRNWSVAQLADRSGMSRASFAAHFRETVGSTPADYLANWRISLTQNLGVRRAHGRGRLGGLSAGSKRGHFDRRRRALVAHERADAVLLVLAGALPARVRGNDLARHGGQPFQR